ncbi:Ger(x)C family spore germination protein [Paenibacillus thermotolerans]|uniref:Ger(x)C family spore germination protein n=1 Tax=Paenibacillus thermotolerans TaxID=3027807 RepID=UPI002367CAD7|nr:MULTISPECIES: Ger(x)C family spore germination protein [unclassified Paenibacillus]
MLRRGVKLICCMTVLAVASGCWDRIEIDERGFVVGIAIDAATSKESAKREQEEAGKKEGGKNNFEVTYQIVNVEGFSGNNGGGTANQKAFLNVTSVEDSMFTVSAQMTTKLSRGPFFEHLKVIVISEEVAEKNFGKVLDFFLRDSETRRNVKIMVAKGKARKALEILPYNEKMPAIHLNTLAENIIRSARMTPASRMGDVHEKLLKHESFVIQHIKVNNKEASIAGAAVFDGNTNKIAGFLNEVETEGLNFITGNIQGGMVEFQAGKEKVGFEIEESKKRLKLDYGDEHFVKITVYIEAAGIIAETFKQRDFLKESTFTQLEPLVAKKIEEDARACIEKLQNDYKKDVLGINSYLNQSHYRLWKKIIRNWEKGEHVFSKSKIEVKAKVTIKRTGTINESRREFR